MADLFKGITAGLIATLAVTAVLAAKAISGLFPSLDLIALVNATLHAPPHALAGWIVHGTAAAVGGGAIYAWLEPGLDADHPLKRGILFGVLTWIASMVLFMPAAGAGAFGLRIGAHVPMAALLLHLGYGGLLGWLYDRLGATVEYIATRASR
jgi:hypothetical protein